MNLKQKKKQIIAVALAGLMVAGATVPVATVLSPSVSAVQETRESETGTIKDKYGNELEYKQTSSVSMSIVGANTVSSKVEIPETINGVKVRYIGTSAFEDNNDIKEVIFPNGLLTVGFRAFANCDSLEEIELPDSAVNLESEAFSDCDSLKSVRLPKGTKLGIADGSYDIFSRCINLREINFGDSKGTVEDYPYMKPSEYGNYFHSNHGLYKYVEHGGKPTLNLAVLCSGGFGFIEEYVDGDKNNYSFVLQFLTEEEKRRFDEVESERDYVYSHNYESLGMSYEEKREYADKLDEERADIIFASYTKAAENLKINFNVPYSKNTSTTPEKPTTPTNPTTPQATKGSIMLDTANYILAPGNKYTIGAFIKDKNGKSLTPAEVKQLVDSGKLKVRDSRTGSIVDLEQLSTGHFRVTGKNVGTCYILYEIGGTHASIRIDVQNGVKQHGTAVRNTSIFTKDVF